MACMLTRMAAGECSCTEKISHAHDREIYRGITWHALIGVRINQAPFWLEVAHTVLQTRMIRGHLQLHTSALSEFSPLKCYSAAALDGFPPKVHQKVVMHIAPASSDSHPPTSCIDWLHAISEHCVCSSQRLLRRVLVIPTTGGASVLTGFKPEMDRHGMLCSVHQT